MKKSLDWGSELATNIPRYSPESQLSGYCISNNAKTQCRENFNTDSLDVKKVLSGAQNWGSTYPETINRDSNLSPNSIYLWSNNYVKTQHWENFNTNSWDAQKSLDWVSKLSINIPSYSQQGFKSEYQLSGSCSNNYVKTQRQKSLLLALIILRKLLTGIQM